MKEKFYWKVVRVTESKTYASACMFVPAEYLLHYKIGKKTTPLIGKIFVFKTRKRARLFKRANTTWNIKLKVLKVRVIGTPVEETKCIDLYLSPSLIEKFWKNDITISYDDMWECPDNTFGVDGVIPVEISH